MVLGSAQYKRQDNMEEEMVASALEDEVSSVTSDHLRSMDSAPGGGSVRFVDSTIRYHINGTSYWNGRSGLEKALLIVVMVLFMFCVIMLIVVKSHAETHHDNSLHIHTMKQSNESTFCLSPDCVKLAANILTSADFEADPCEDFHQYACGGWEKVVAIPDSRSSWNKFEKIVEANQLVLKVAFERPLSEQASEAEKKLVAYYTSCLDPNDTLEHLGGQQLLDQLDMPDIGGWRILDDVNSDDSDTNLVNEANFQSRLEELHLGYQTSGLFSWSVQDDDLNSTRHVIVVDQGGLTLSKREDYLQLNVSENVKVLDALTKTIIKLAKLLIQDKKNSTQIPPEQEALIKEHAKGIIEFETKLANITIPDTERQDLTKLYHPMNLSSLQEKAPFINWTHYFNTAFNKVHRTITDKDKIVVHAPLYLENLTKLIKEQLKTKKLRRNLNNYMVWHLVRNLKKALSEKYRDADDILEKSLYGKVSQYERWRLCVADSDTVMGFASGALFIKDTFNGDSKSVAQDMVNGIKDTFRQRLKAVSWMDKETLGQALDKADAIEDMIGYPDYILDPVKLDKKYEDLVVNEDDYFGNTLNAHKFSLMESLARLDKPVDRTRWSMTPPAVNAYYQPNKNEIVFPAGILQSPFFNLNWPKSVNYGAIGVVIGHELSHAFDNQGMKYDSKGNIRDWWCNNTKEEYTKRTKCFVNQYSDFSVDSENFVSGNLTLGENIADNGGVKVSYHAYKNWLKEKNNLESEKPLPGLEKLTHDQLFFLSFAQVWCSKSTKKALLKQLKEDEHSPPQFRIMGTLANSKEFAEAYHCRKNSTMNPVKKCEVW